MNRTLAALAAATLLVAARAYGQTPAATSAPTATTTDAPPAAAAIPPTAPTASPIAAPASAPKGPIFWGFIDAQFSQTVPHPGTTLSTQVPDTASANTSTFELRRARIGVRGDIVPKVDYAVLYDGADTSLKDAYLGERYIPGLEVRLGQWKTPFGYEQQESDTKLLWVNNSYVIANLARGPDTRDIGGGIIGSWAVAGPLSAELSASLVDGAGPNRKDDLDEKNVWSRAGVAVKLTSATVRVGGSFGYGRQADYGKDKVFGVVAATTTTTTASLDDTYFFFKTYGGDVTVDMPWLFAAAEIIQSDRAVSKWTSSTTTPPATVSRYHLTARGWYVGAYAKTPWNVGPVFRYDRYDPNDAVALNAYARYTLGAYVDILPVNARLIFNYEIDDSQQDAGKSATTTMAARPGNRAILYGQVVF